MLNNDRRQAVDTVPDRRVVSLLEAAAAPTEPGPLPGEVEALAAFRASQNATRRQTMLTTLTSAKVVMAAAVSGLVLTGGVGAAAAAGSLPGAAQDTASTLLDKVGVTVPGANDRSGGHADQRGTTEADESSETTDSTETTDATETTEPATNGKGAVVSDIARGDAEGAEKGKAVSEYASGGKAQVGEHEAQGPKSDEHEAQGPKSGEHADDEKSDGQAKPAGETSDDESTSAGTDTAEETTTEEGHSSSTNGNTKAEKTGEGRDAADSQTRP